MERNDECEIKYEGNSKLKLDNVFVKVFGMVVMEVVKIINIGMKIK